MDSKLLKVRKRNGAIVEFDSVKIREAIRKAFIASQVNYIDEVITGIVEAAVEKCCKNAIDFIIGVESIQDIVEAAIADTSYASVAKVYSSYRSRRTAVRQVSACMLDCRKTVDKYVKETDWRVKENSTVTYSIGGLILNNSGAITANYWLSNIYAEDIANAHRNAEMHIHDLSMLTGYCAGWSLRQLILEGLGGVPGKITSSPAKHLATICNQMVNFLGIMQNEWAGAQAFSSFDTYLAPFVKVDDLSYDSVKKCIESFIYGVNTPSRWGCVDAETEVLSTTGFKKYDELKEGDSIYTWKDGQLQVNRVNKVIVKPFNGKLHSYCVGKYNQTVTPNHRVLVQKHNSNECKIKLSEEIFNVKTPYSLPVQLADSAIPDIPLSVEEIALAAMVYTDGHIEMRKESVHKVTIYKSPKRVGNEELCRICDQLHLKFVLSRGKGNFGEVNKYTFYGEHARRIIELTGNTKTCIDEKFLRMSAKQATVFLQTWVTFDGDEDKLKLQCDNQTIADQIQQIAILAGYTSYFVRRNKTLYVKLRKTANVIPTKREEVPYDGVVWCPNVENGTAIFRKNGSVYISGQTQAPFSNITLDWTVPKDLAYQPAIVGGKLQDFTYGECQKEADMINKAFLEIMISGDATGRGFQYPIPTYSITKDFDWSDTENNKLLFEMTAKYGTPYFSNYVNSDMQPDDVRSMCCRLRLDLRELRRKAGGYFGSGESTGSIGVVTLNLPRLAYLSETEEAFYARLEKLLDLAVRSLDIKRDVITKLLNDGLYPYTKHYLGGFSNHFSTIGIVGMHEAGLNANWLRHGMPYPDTVAFAKNILLFLRKKLEDYQVKNGNLYNLEATPAESTAYRLAMHDKQDFPSIITSGGDYSSAYYTNSTNLPVNATDDMFTALDLQDDIQVLYTSGTVFHVFLGERISDWKSAANLVRKIAQNYKLPYYTLSPTYSVCEQHGYIAGEVKKCPTCGNTTEVYSRITGYYRPIRDWNAGKSEEYKDREEYKYTDDYMAK